MYIANGTQYIEGISEYLRVHVLFWGVRHIPITSYLFFSKMLASSNITDRGDTLDIIKIIVFYNRGPSRVCQVVSCGRLLAVSIEHGPP